MNEIRLTCTGKSIKPSILERISGMITEPVRVNGKLSVSYDLVPNLKYTVDDIVYDDSRTLIKVSPKDAKIYNDYFPSDDMERINLYGGIYFRVSPKSDLTSITIKDKDHTCTFDIKKIPEFYEFRNKLELMCSLRDV